MSCRMDCSLCPAADRCGRQPNFCLRPEGGCEECRDPISARFALRGRVMEQLGGLDLAWPRPVTHHQPADLPLHLPILVQAYPEPVRLPWVALHGGRVFGVTGRSITSKHRQPLRQVYRLSPSTKLALELYVEDRVLEGIWAERRQLIPQLAELGFDLILSPNFSVWRDASRFEQLVQQRRSFAFYHELREAGLPALPDVGWSRFDPDGRLWAEWINGQPGLAAVSIFCGGRKIHAEKRAHLENVEDIALFHRAVRPGVAFVLGGVHSPSRLRDFRRAAPGRKLAICNGMAYACAQRRRLLGQRSMTTAISARNCFLRNSSFNDRVYEHVLSEAG